MKKTLLFSLVVVAFLVSAAYAQEKPAMPSPKKFKGLQLKDGRAQSSAGNQESSSFALKLDDSEKAQASTSIKQMESLSKDAHHESFLYVTATKEGTLVFSTSMPSVDVLPEVVPYVGVISKGGAHNHAVYVDPKALDLLKERGCGPGSSCGNGGGGNAPPPPPPPVINPCGPGSYCGQQKPLSNDSPSDPQGKNPCEKTQPGTNAPKDSKACPQVTNPVGPPSR